MVEEPEESVKLNALGAILPYAMRMVIPKGAWPNSRNSSAAILRTSLAPRERVGFAMAMNSREGPKISRLFPPFSLARAAIQHRQSHGALAFVATEHGSGSSGEEKGKR